MSTTKRDNQYILGWAKWRHIVYKKGGSCINCGENRIECLCFHHSNPCQKESNMKDLKNGRLSSMMKEASKCDLLCQRCHREIHAVGEGRRKERKKWLLELAQKIKCEQCGYQGENLTSLDFHHREPDKRRFGLSKIVSSAECHSAEAVLEEINKCDLLCANCHLCLHFDRDRYERHLPQIEQKIKNFRELPPKYSREQIKSMYESGMTQKQITEELGCSKGTVSYALGDIPRRRRNGMPKMVKCAKCNAEINNPHKNQRYCSQKCESRRRRIRPDREVLVELLQSKSQSQSQIARDYDVSRVAVHKWLKHYNLLPYE